MIKKFFTKLFPNICFHDWNIDLKVAYKKHLYLDMMCKKCNKHQCRIIWS